MESEEKRKDCSHYGVDYSLVVRFSGVNLHVSAVEKLTGVVWKGEFSSEYVENVTRKTGNFKKFPIFLKMLLAAMENSSKSVLLELVSHLQMDALRSNKKSQAPASRPDSRLYLILTYAVEFDKVHYPLPLTQESLSPEEQNSVIRQLRLQIEGLKRLIPPQHVSAIDLVNENARIRDQLQQLTETVTVSSTSEEKIANLQQELSQIKAKNAQKVAYLQKINIGLQEELKTAQGNIDAYLQDLENGEKGRDQVEKLEGEIEEISSELAETKEELNTVKEELKRYRGLYDESERVQNMLRSTLKSFQTDLHLKESFPSRYDPPLSDFSSPEDVGTSIRSSHRRLFDDQDFQDVAEEEERFLASGNSSKDPQMNTSDIEIRMSKIRELLRKQEII